MRRFVLIALVAVIALLAGATFVLFQRYRKTTTDFTDSQSRYTEAINAIAEIQDSLSAIAPGDTTVRILSEELRTEQKLTEPQTRQALDRIALISASIQRTKEKIRDLEARLKQSGVNITGLQRMIGRFKASVAEKEELIGQLTGRVDSLQTQVTGLESQVQQEQQTIRVREQSLEEKRRELGTIVYIIGTKNELTAAGVIVAKGGFLGLGKTLEPSGHYDESRFTPLDTDQETVIHIPAVKVQVLSAQPTASYELRLVADGTELHILDAKEFRKVKHVVILKP